MARRLREGWGCLDFGVEDGNAGSGIQAAGTSGAARAFSSAMAEISRNRGSGWVER
jgi:hypothetical protein